MSYVFEQAVFQSGGKTSDGTLMISGKTLMIRQCFERHNWEDIVFSNLRAFCVFLETNYHKDGRKVFFKEQSGSVNFLAYSSSPHKGYKSEIFLIGIFRRVS